MAAATSTGPRGQMSAPSSSSVAQGSWSITSDGSRDAPALVPMDEERTAGPSGYSSTFVSSARKRGSWCSSSEDTDIYSVDGDDSSDGSFVSVMSRKAKRRLIKTSSPASTSTVKARSERWPHTILFMPVDPSASLRKLNRQAISNVLEGIAQNEIKEVRLNTRKNVLAVDTTHADTLEKLRMMTEFGDVKVRAVVPMTGTCTAGVIYDIDLAIPNTDLPILIKPAYEGVVIKHISRLGNSRCVKIVFKGDSIPTHVKVGHFRHVVRHFVPKPLQCHKCFKIGHVKGVCANSTVCPRCAEAHTVDTCCATTYRCGNCRGTHEATSKECPRLKKEMGILKEMVRDNSTHREASQKIRRRRRHRRKRSSHGDIHAPLRSTPPSTSSRKPESTRIPPPAKPLSPEDWPVLANARPSEQPSRSLLPVKANAADDEAPTADRQIIPMLRSIVSVIRSLLTSIDTPTARSGLQVLDALSPVLASLQ